MEVEFIKKIVQCIRKRDSQLIKICLVKERVTLEFLDGSIALFENIHWTTALVSYLKTQIQKTIKYDFKLEIE